MHQPIYQLTENGDYLMPWVRLHAVKDYLDMILWTKKFDKLKLNFNFVPVLVDAIIDYAENNAHDIHSRLTVKPVDRLNDEDKLFILTNFFDANYQTMILPNEEYHRLYKTVQASGNNDITVLTNQEYADLTALFNLVWIDSSFRTSNSELKKLIKKGKNYTDEDRARIIEIHREIIRKIVPTVKSLIKKDKIEIMTSPYYHPILPVLLDFKNIKKTPMPDDETTGFNMEQDAELQTKMALDRMEEVFGKRPEGIWPSEHCVSKKTLNMLAKLGVKWSISDEGILANSIKFEFEHDFKGYINEPYHLLKTYNFKTTNQSDIKMIFREATIPNLISFEYQNHNPLATANDLYDRIKIIQSKILSSPDKEHLLTIALDGENCWENYLEDGESFLRTLYELITEDETLETVLVSEYLSKTKEDKPLDRIASGSWINRNFKLWIDEPVKDLAWTYLKRVKEDFSQFSRREPNHPNLDSARREILICEGSDWFWWYGEPNDSGRDNIFDFLFRTHLKNVYRYLELDAPAFLDDALSDLTAAKPSKYPKALITPEISGKNANADEEWNNAGYIEIPDGPVLRESKLFDKIRFGNDEDNFYLKFNMNRYIKENSDLSQRTYQMYIYFRKSHNKQTLSPVRLINKTENISPVSMEKFHNELQIAIKNNKLQLVRLIKAIPGDMWVLEQARTIETAYGETLDLKIPFSALGINNGDTLEFLFVNANYGIKDFYIPNEMVLSVTRPSLVLK